MDIDAIIAEYVRLRDACDAAEARVKEECAPAKENMRLIEAALLKYLQGTSSQHIKTPHGTAYLSSLVSMRVADWDALLQHILDTEGYDLLERRVSKTACMDRSDPVPGVERSEIIKVGIRRS